MKHSYSSPILLYVSFPILPTSCWWSLGRECKAMLRSSTRTLPSSRKSSHWKISLSSLATTSSSQTESTTSRTWSPVTLAASRSSTASEAEKWTDSSTDRRHWSQWRRCTCTFTRPVASLWLDSQSPSCRVCLHSRIWSRWPKWLLIMSLCHAKAEQFTHLSCNLDRSHSLSRVMSSCRSWASTMQWRSTTARLVCIRWWISSCQTMFLCFREFLEKM